MPTWLFILFFHFHGMLGSWYSMVVYLPKYLTHVYTCWSAQSNLAPLFSLEKNQIHC